MRENVSASKQYDVWLSKYGNFPDTFIKYTFMNFMRTLGIQKNTYNIRYIYYTIIFPKNTIHIGTKGVSIPS